MEEIQLALAAIALLQKLGPKIEAAVKAGEVSAETQEEVRSEYVALRTDFDAKFDGPEWNT